MLRIIRLFIPLLLLAACRSEVLPPDLEGDPVFSVSARLDGQNLQIAAGKAAYFLQPAYQQDEWGVYECSGAFQQQGCEGCPGTLRIVLRGHRVSAPGESLHADSAFRTGIWRYMGQDYRPDPYAFKFNASSDAPGPYVYEWDFGDGDGANVAAPSHRFSGAKEHTVTLRLRSANGCNDRVRNQLSTGTAFQHCPVNIRYLPTGNNRVVLSAELLHAPSNRSLMMWSLGDHQLRSGVVELEHTYTQPGLYEVKFAYTDPNGCTGSGMRNVFTGPGTSCASAIHYEALDLKRFAGQAYIEWIAADGRRYSSRSERPQPAGSFFEVLESSPYETSPNGTATRKLRARFACTLFAEDDPAQQVVLDEAEAVFAVGYR